ncbi:hypothetical protein CICLE_v10013129mg [Citrus x clementina]|uniref:Uncharacterized protein n=1 Tax=Citrus clementina TaxID=85681 RepID=V4SZN6_CITCL|nr:hypothetical protein CICLE_v10013129mg [Citrus x clementina]
MIISRPLSLRRFSSALVLLVILLFSSIYIINNTSVAAASVSLKDNIAMMNIIIAGSEEFLMESEVSHRLLAASGGNPISYASLEKPAFCDAKIYGNCIKPTSGNNRRPCTYYNTCKRGGS